MVAGDLSSEQRKVALVLWLFGCLDMLAFIAVLMPRDWMEYGAAISGLGTLPSESIVGYLARSASALYALHGVMVLYVAFDVIRYWELIRFTSYLAVLHGLIMFGIDLSEQMPPWWRMMEGPSFSVTGVLVLWLQRRADATVAMQKLR